MSACPDNLENIISEAASVATRELEMSRTVQDGIRTYSLGATAVLPCGRLTVVDYRENMTDQETDGTQPIRTLEDPTILQQIGRVLEAGLRVRVR